MTCIINDSGRAARRCGERPGPVSVACVAAALLREHRFGTTRTRAGYFRSKRSSSETFTQAATKSLTNFSLASALA